MNGAGRRGASDPGRAVRDRRRRCSFMATRRLKRIELAQRRHALRRCAASSSRASDVVIVGDRRQDAGRPGRSERCRSTASAHAKVIEQLTKAGAAVIAYDVQFTEHERRRRADDALFEAVAAARRRSCSAPRDVNNDGTTDDLRRRRGARTTAARPRPRRAFPTDADGVLRPHRRSLSTASTASPSPRCRAKLGRQTLPRRRRRVDRLPGPARHDPAAELRRRRERQLRRPRP